MGKRFRGVARAKFLSVRRKTSWYHLQTTSESDKTTMHTHVRGQFAQRCCSAQSHVSMKDVPNDVVLATNELSRAPKELCALVVGHWHAQHLMCNRNSVRERVNTIKLRWL